MIGIIRALHLIDSNPRSLLPAGHALLNQHIATLLALEFVTHAANRHVAYALTAKGRACLEANK